MKTTPKIWKTITIGGIQEYSFPDEINVSTYARDIQEKTPLAKKKEEVHLVRMTPKDLGFTECPTTKELFDEENLKKYGVELCPSEVGLALRQQYLDQPTNEWLYIGMERIAGSDGNPRVFRVERSSDGAPWLDGSWVLPGRRWGLGIVIVFRFRKSSELEHSEPGVSSDTESSVFSTEASAEVTLESALKIVLDSGYTIKK